MLIDAYGSIGRVTDELRLLNEQANGLRSLYAQFDTTTYVNRVASLYAASIYGTYKFRQDGALKTVEFRANTSGNPIAQTGTLRGTIRLYSPTYIEVRNYFKTKAGVGVDLFLCRKGNTWVTVIDGKTITLRR